MDRLIEGSVEAKLPTIWTDGKASQPRITATKKIRDEESQKNEDAGAEPAGQMRDEKLHAAVARSTFGSKRCQSTSCS